MRLFLNAGFGEPIGVEALDLIRRLGFSGVRQDVVKGDVAEALCQELGASTLTPILLVGGGKMRVDRTDGASPEAIIELARHVAIQAERCGLFDREFPAAIELGNEPDTFDTQQYHNRPDLFARVVREGAAAIRQLSTRAVVVSGGVGNTSDFNLDYLSRAIAFGLPDDCAIGYHCYRTTATPGTPHKRFRSRDEEFTRLRQVVGSRPIWCTEVGWHTAPSTVKTGWFSKKKIRFSDEQVAAFFQEEADIHARNGAEVFAWFQHKDGTNPDAYEQAFGICRVAGDVKPVGQRVAAVAARYTPPFTAEGQRMT